MQPLRDDSITIDQVARENECASVREGKGIHHRSSNMSTQATQSMTTQEIANTLTKLCSVGKFDEAMNKLYATNIVSMEAGAPPGQSREAKGIDAVRKKAEWWTANHEVHSAKVEGP